MILRTVLLTVITLCTTQFVFSQEKMDEENRPHHRLTILMMHAHVPQTIAENGAKKTFVVPAWGFDYDYWFNAKWAVGIHTDLLAQQFKIEKTEDAAEIVRSYPLSVSAVGIYKATRHFSFIAGIGREFEKEESLNLLDLGVEYGFELPKNFELSLNLKYANKFKAYDTWIFGVGVSKALFSANAKD